jgi:hypothetical protein
MHFSTLIDSEKTCLLADAVYNRLVAVMRCFGGADEEGSA